jgi:hypothetical protein
MHSYSHNCTQESADQIVTRRTGAVEISKAKFTEHVPRSLLTELTVNLGHPAHAFYQTETSLFVDVQGIDYIFKQRNAGVKI